MVYETELYHFGIKGQKWGVRRYQNRDGTLTEAGKKRKNWDVQQAREAGRELDRKKRLYKQAKLARNMSVLRGESGVSAGYKIDNYNQAKNEYRLAKKEYNQNAPVAAKIRRGSMKTTVALGKIGALYVVDQKVFGGAGTHAARVATEAAVKVLGMTALTTVALARGNTNIKWGRIR